MSPIKGLSERVMIPRIGKIHLGYRDDKGYPVKTEYFVLPKDHPLYSQMVRLYGEKPKELPIRIPVEEEEHWCSQYYRCYSRSRGRVCKGDGEIATRMVAKGTQNLAWKDCKEVEMRDIICPGDECEVFLKKNCKTIMNLQFILPDLPGLGIWQIDTTSRNSIIHINSAARLIRAFYGHLAFVPLILSLEPQEVQPLEDGGTKKTVYTMNLRIHKTMRQIALESKLEKEAYLLPVGDDEIPEETTFDPVEPDNRPVEEQIDQLWGPEPGKNPLDKAEEIEEPPAEGSDRWLAEKLADLGIKSEIIINEVLVARYHLDPKALDQVDIINNFKMLTSAQRADFTNLVKAKMKANKPGKK